MGSVSELCLDFNPPYTAKTVSGLLREFSLTRDPSKRLMKVEELLNSLEEERKKIDAFRRELPLCMSLINEAIEAVKEEEKRYRSMLAEKDRPVLEEFMPVNRKLDEDGELEREKERDSKDKMNWMSSAQLWSDSNDMKKSICDLKPKSEQSEESALEKQFIGCKSKSNGGPFMQFKGFSAFEVRKEEKESLPIPELSLLSPRMKNTNADSGIGCLKLNSSNRVTAIASSSAAAATNIKSNLQPQQQLPRKARRCWSPELHRRFLRALDELGGSQVATPKQIRDVMKVDGLTNDEVKSHLQKYRLHTRRLPASAATTANEKVAVMGGMGGLWVTRDHFRASKQSTSQSSSPQGPLQLSGTSRGMSTNGGDSGEDEDGKSETHSWKSHHGPGGEETE